MKLIDLINKLNGDELVFIGSKSAFFFIGYPKDFIAEEEKLNKEWFETYTNGITRTEKYIEKHLAEEPHEGDMERVKNFKTGKVELKPIDYNVLYKKWKDKLQTYINTCTAYKRNADTFKNFSQRNVLESYRNIDNNATIINVEGYEVARFWFYPEYVHFRNSGKIMDFISLEKVEEDDAEDYEEND